MFRNKTFILALSAVLCVILLVLMYLEMKNPELGSSLYNSLKEQILPSAEHLAANPKG